MPSVRNNTLCRGVPAALLLLSLAISGCGSSSSSSSDTSVSSGSTAAETTNASTGGAKVFTDNCGRCHTLNVAGTRGAVGPDLDKSKLSVDEVKDQVMNGRRAMPALGGKLSADEIDAVANYVAIDEGR